MSDPERLTAGQTEDLVQRLERAARELNTMASPPHLSRPVRALEGKPAMSDYYDRDGKPLPDDWYDTKKHGRSHKWGTEHRVARTVVGDITVSTVWLGLNHDYLTGTPIIFETMTFGDQWNNEMERYATEEQAMRGHLAVLDRLRAGNPPFSYLETEAADV